MSEVFINRSAELSRERCRELDIDATTRVKNGFTQDPAANDHNPRIIDGSLNEDGQLAFQELTERYCASIHKVVIDNAWLVHNTPAIDKEDLFSEAQFAILHAALRWDSERGQSFFTYSYKKLDNYIRSAIDDTKSTVRIPPNKRTQVRRARSAQWRCYQQTEHMPSREHVASELNIPPVQADELFAIDALTSEMGSLEGGYFTDDRTQRSVFTTYDAQLRPISPETTLSESVEDEAIIRSMQGQIDKVLNSPFLNLGPHERYVVAERLRTRDPQYLSQIGERLGVSAQRVGIIEEKTLAMLRNPVVIDRIT